MNHARIVLAAVGALVAYLAIGYLLLAILPFEAEVRRHAAVYRPPEAMGSVAPVGMAALFLAMLALAVLHASGHPHGPLLTRGLHFGILVGVLSAGSFVMHNYVSLNIGLRLVLLQALAQFLQWVAAGVAVALIYRPPRP